MSIARHHAEWLSLVEVSGPFLSMSLVEVSGPFLSMPVLLALVRGECSSSATESLEAVPTPALS